MAAVESAPAVPIESPPVDPTLVDGRATADVPPVKPAKEKKAVSKKPALHPTYLEMIREAIASLKERTGSSQYAISKFVEDKHKAHLPANFKKLLLVQLRKLTAAGKLTKLKNSYKIAGKPVTSVSAKLKIKSAAAKPKSTAVKAKKAAVKPKPKSSVAAKPKAKPAAAKLKSAVKLKAVQPKPKTAGRLAKAGKASAKATPSTKPKNAAPVAAKKLKTVPKKAAAVAAKKLKTVKKVPAVKKAYV